jgi:hypothetical protein
MAGMALPRAGMARRDSSASDDAALREASSPLDPRSTPDGLAATGVGSLALAGARAAPSPDGSSPPTRSARGPAARGASTSDDGLESVALRGARASSPSSRGGRAVSASSRRRERSLRTASRVPPSGLRAAARRASVPGRDIAGSRQPRFPGARSSARCDPARASARSNDVSPASAGRVEARSVATWRGEGSAVTRIGGAVRCNRGAMTGGDARPRPRGSRAIFRSLAKARPRQHPPGRGNFFPARAR